MLPIKGKSIYAYLVLHYLLLGLCSAAALRNPSHGAFSTLVQYVLETPSQFLSLIPITRPANLTIAPFPDPFHIPDSDMIIDCNTIPLLPARYPIESVMRLIHDIFNQIQAVLHVGDRRQGNEVLVAFHDDLEMDVHPHSYSTAPHQRAWYSELEAVITGVRMKVTREGGGNVYCLFSRDSNPNLKIGNVIIRGPVDRGARASRPHLNLKDLPAT